MMLSKRDWESDFFSQDIWELECDQYLTECKDLKVSGLTVSKVRSDDYSSINKLNEMGFSYSEGEYQFKYKLNEEDSFLESLPYAKNENLAELISLADKIYSHSRFREPWFNEEDRDKFYKQWVTNSLKTDFEDLFLVDIYESRIRGLITLKLTGNTANIGLVAVGEQYKRIGVGKRLLDGAKRECVKKKIKELYVSTQLSNKAAIKLYEKNGFKFRDLKLWFYKVGGKDDSI